MKAVILAGGMGTRLREETEFRPKPMVEIGGRPILWHIMKTLSTQGINDFVICLGYKGDYIKDFFMNYESRTHDITVKLGDNEGTVQHSKASAENWTVTLANTGLTTMTGGRIKRIEEYVKGEKFLCTYGDGVADIDINKLLNFHKSHGKMITMTAVRPAARFGELQLGDNRVISFEEKPQMNDGWINGGYFVIEPAFFDLIDGDATLLEREPLERAVALGELMAYRHEGFWQCMDTKRDLDLLQSLSEHSAPWEK